MTTNNMTTNNMNMTTNANTKVHSLVQCHYTTSAPATTALNKAATVRAVASANAARSSARLYNTILQAKGTAIGKAISLQQRTGVAIRRLGLPCPTGGIYMRVRDITEAQNIFDDAQQDLAAIREDILATYPQLRAEAVAQLGAFAREVDIPSATQVAAAFTMRLVFINQPVALPDGVLSGLADEVANRVRAESQQQIDAMLHAAHAGPLADLKDQLEEFIDRMRNAQRIHLTQFDKLRAEVKRVHYLNVLDLPQINEVLELVDEVTAFNGSELSADERVHYAQKAETAADKAASTLDALGL